jgi:hypothetical protein
VILFEIKEMIDCPRMPRTQRVDGRDRKSPDDHPFSNQCFQSCVVTEYEAKFVLNNCVCNIYQLEKQCEQVHLMNIKYSKHSRFIPTSQPQLSQKKHAITHTHTARHYTIYFNQ